MSEMGTVNGMNIGKLPGLMRNVAKQVNPVIDEPTPPEPKAEVMPEPAPPQRQPEPIDLRTEPEPEKPKHNKTKKKIKPPETPQKIKAGWYITETVLDKLDRVWQKQPRRERVSKSVIVENMLRQALDLPELEENAK